MENFGKLKVFQYFCSKLSKNLQFSNYFEIFKDLDCRRAWGCTENLTQIWLSPWSPNQESLGLNTSSFQIKSYSKGCIWSHVLTISNFLIKSYGWKGCLWVISRSYEGGSTIYIYSLLLDFWIWIWMFGFLDFSCKFSRWREGVIRRIFGSILDLF